MFETHTYTNSLLGRVMCILKTSSTPLNSIRLCTVIKVFLLDMSSFTVMCVLSVSALAASSFYITLV